MRRCALSVLAVFAALYVCATLPANAEEVTFYITNAHPNAVELEFYSEDRTRVWPGNNEVYVLRDSARHQYTLRCNYGEHVCYAAWVSGNTDSYWGLGYAGRNSCTDCCQICNGGHIGTRLTP